MSEFEDGAQALLDEIDLGSASGAKAAPVEVEILRPLSRDDIPVLLAGADAMDGPGQRLKRIGAAHHRLAQMTVQGMAPEQIGAITGYSPGYIGGLQRDPSFQDLVAYYASNEELAYVDVLERMKALQVASLEELQKRLEEEPEGWTKRELMELADMMGKPLLARMNVQARGPVAGADGVGGGIQIGITFVAPKEAPPVPRVELDATLVESVDV